MNNIVKALVVGVALSAIFCPSLQAASVPFSIDELRIRYPDLPKGFNDEKLLEAARLGTAADIEQEFHLGPNWTGEEYARAVALDKLTQLRERNGLLSNFTRDQIVDNKAAIAVSDFIREHNLSAHFTQAELVRRDGEKRVIQEQGLKAPAGAKEYAAFAGKRRSDEFIEEWHLSEHWSFEELRAVAGPEKAARLSRIYDIHAGMSHDEMVDAIGQHEAREYAERKNIPANFTADEAVQAEGEWTLKFVREDFVREDLWGKAPLTGEINEEWLVRNARAKELYFVTQDYPGLQGNFDEKQLFDYLTKKADANMRERYGFVGPYREADVARAAAESLVAETRLEYNLPLHFSQADLEAAMKAKKRFNPYY
jgi:hypothetical protein